MCALFGPRVGVHQAELELTPHVWPEPLAMPVTTQAAELLEATVHAGPLGETQAAVNRVDLAPAPVASRKADMAMSAATAAPPEMQLSVLGHAVRLPPLTVTGDQVDDLALQGRARKLNLTPRVQVHEALEAMRARRVERRGVPGRLLTEAQAAHWRKRIGDSKRVPLKLVDLVAVFPDVPIVGDQPVQYAHGALSYPLPEEPVPLTTVVIAKHLTSGALFVGRFAKT